MSFLKNIKRKLIKTVSGAAGGFLASGFNPIGAIAGGATGMLSGGKGKVFKNVMMGAATGGAAGTIATKLGWQSTIAKPMFGDKYALLTRAVDYAGAPTKVSKALPVASALANLQNKTPVLSADEAATQASFTPYTDLFNKTTSLMSTIEGSDGPPLYGSIDKAPPSNNLLPLVLLGGAALFIAYA